MADDERIDAGTRKRVGISPLLVFLLAPFLISGGFLLMLALLGGLLKLLVIAGLTEWVWPIYCVGILAWVPAGFLLAVKIGRFLLGESRPRFQFRMRRFMTWTVVLAVSLAALVAADREGQASGCGYPLFFMIWVSLLAAIGYVVIRLVIFGIRHPS